MSFSVTGIMRHIGILTSTRALPSIRPKRLRSGSRPAHNPIKEVQYSEPGPVPAGGEGVLNMSPELRAEPWKVGRTFAQ